MLATLFIYSVLFPPCKSGMAQGLGVGGQPGDTPLSPWDSQGLPECRLSSPGCRPILIPFPPQTSARFTALERPVQTGKGGWGRAGRQCNQKTRGLSPEGCLRHSPPSFRHNQTLSSILPNELVNSV